MKTRWIYLLHYSKPIGSKKHTAQHYIGSAIDLRKRLNQHWTGKARCAISNAFYLKGIPFVLALYIPGDRQMERKLKSRHNHKHLCPICRGKGD